MQKHDVSSFEDARWRSFAQSHEFRHAEALELIQGNSVLDIGCGDGLQLRLLREKGIPAEGIDVSEEAVASCLREGLSARVYDPAHPLPYSDASIPTVLLLDVLEHVFDPTALLKEAARIAQKEVIISVPNFSSLPARLQTLCGNVPENNRANKGHVYWFNKPVLDARVAESGLSYGELRMNTFGPFAALHIPAAIWPNGLALSFVARLEKGDGLAKPAAC